MSKKKQGGMVFSTNPQVMEEIATSHSDLPTLEPQEQRLTVRRESKGRKGKVVTLVEGFEGSEGDLVALSKRLKTACGVGGSAKEGEIIVQGDLVERVHTLLLEWGYQRSKRR